MYYYINRTTVRNWIAKNKKRNQKKNSIMIAQLLWERWWHLCTARQHKTYSPPIYYYHNKSQCFFFHLVNVCWQAPKPATWWCVLQTKKKPYLSGFLIIFFWFVVLVKAATEKWAKKILFPCIVCKSMQRCEYPAVKSFYFGTVGYFHIKMVQFNNNSHIFIATQTHNHK